MNRPLPPILFSLTVLPLVTASMVVVFLTMENEAEVVQYPAVIAVAYLFGSIPWGYILLRWRLGVDIREYGSGRIGMANVLRTGGSKVAALVLLLDMGKGVLAVLLARAVIDTTAGEVVTGLAVLAGHNWPLFLQFKGGRGVVTGLGGLAVMAPMAAGLGALVFIPITLGSRYLSLGSMIAVVVAAISMLALGLAGVYSSGYTLYAFVASAIILWQHRDNIRRIRQGTERRLGQPAKPAE